MQRALVRARIVALVVVFLGLALARIAGAAPQPEELGTVRWGRSLEEAWPRSAETGRPVFALFQEVPGCATCVAFGAQVLSHPLLVEAIEDEFVPVAIHNNGGGTDRAALERFGEPAWNNPVVRFLSADGRDLLLRRDRIWSAGAIAERMVLALTAGGRPVPRYLRELAYELRDRVPQRAVFGTHCYWEGEGCLGGLPGVLATRAAWWDGREVVEVTFDPERTGYRGLLAAVKLRGCADGVVALSPSQRGVAEEIFGAAATFAGAAPRAASEADQKRHLRGSRLAALDLHGLQALRVNAALWAGADPLAWLSPRQRARVSAR